MSNVLMCVLTALAMAQVAPRSPEAELDVALGAAGLTSRTARFDEGLLRFFRQGEFTTPLYSALSENPWRAPFLMDTKRRDMATYAARPNDSLMAGGAWVGWGTRRTLVGNPNAAEEALAKRPDGLAQVLATMKTQGLVAGSIPPTAEVPKAVQQAAALILATTVRVRQYRQLAIRALGDPDSVYRLVSKGEIDDADLATSTRLIDIDRRFATQMLAAGAHDLSLAIQTAAPLVSTVPASTKYAFKVNTAWGVIRLDGGHDNAYGPEPNLLTLDTGGNDTYIGCPATTSATNWCSVVLDTEGNDRYVSDAALLTTPVREFAGRKKGDLPGPAGAVLGYSMLFDLSGNDLYRSHRPGLGSGKYGVGILYDGEGTDTYDAYADSEGFGLFGAGILEDNGVGDDTYSGFTQVQGVGLTQGFGYLVDRGGNDKYLANDEVIDFPSAQSDKHNNSMAQGAGYGRRADYLEGQSLGGGVGILYDLSGNDTYTCGVFGQGVGYWEGVGALWDGGGDDTYLGQWYVQGASAHFAIGYLEDEAGNDRYTAPMNMAQGAGHDFSVGYLIDRAGDDTYRAPNLSLGAGNANGIGWFADLAGNDTYITQGITLGQGAEAPKGSVRSRCLTLGVFMDLGGRDTYPASVPWAGNDVLKANWTDRMQSTPESQVGVFYDKG